MRITLILILLALMVVAWPLYFPVEDGHALSALISASLNNSLVKSLIAVGALMLTLRLLDYVAHIHFEVTYARILDEPIAAALYHAGRIVAVAMLLGNVFR